jgi:deoxyribonuclease (pyrimidine dimer)
VTRINCVPVAELHSKHLVAEYRELPRVFKLAEAYAIKHGPGRPDKAPTKYTLGKGHVLFFYTRLGYCHMRFLQLVAEMQRRGYEPKHLDTPHIEIPATWLQPWRPDPKAIRINRERIKLRMPK